MAIFEVWSTDGQEAVDYVFHGYGSIDYYDDPDDDKLSGSSYNDHIHEFEDGSYVVVGHTGNTYGDAFEVEEKPYKFEKYNGNSGFELYYDGEECTKELVDNDPRPGEGLPDWISPPKLKQWAKERWSFSEDSADGSTEKTSDTPEHLYGGGEGYGNLVTADDADYHVSTHDGLRDALSAASSGEVVFVDGDAEIYSPSKSERYHVPAGVTLASDRGVNGSDGALLHTDAQYSYGAEGLVYTESDARVTGLRVRGPHPDVEWREHSYDYEMSGIRANGSNVEIDNNEVWGWAVNIKTGENTHVHHNHSHHANMKGLGYCVATGGTEGALIEWNYFNHWRHVVAAHGTGGYEARYNLIDPPALAHAMDQHSPGGTYTKLHHNTYRVYTDEDVASGDPRCPFATFRGEDPDNAEVYKNWSYNDWPPRDEPSEYFTDEFITHPKNGGKGWEGIDWWDNHLDPDTEPDSDDVGAPRPYNH